MNIDFANLLKFQPKSLQEPNAWVGHLPFAYWVITALKPKVFVELGTHTGNSYFSFCQSILENKSSTKAYAVDTWKGDIHAGFYDDLVFQLVDRSNEDYRSFSALLRTTFDSALDYFADKSIDLLHIDGLHTYDAVKHDFESWLPKMSNRGVILFHDTNVKRDNFGVHRLWEEISSKYNSLEFFHSHGLGIIDLSPDSSSVIPDTEIERHQLREIFAGLSEQMLVRFERDAATAQRDAATAQRDAATAQRDAATAQRDAATAQLDAVLATKTFRWTKDLRDFVSRTNFNNS
jgi:hypothetical protein